jgi:hypothetical protein
MEEDSIQLMLHKAICLLEETNTRLDEIERRLDEQQQELATQELRRTEDVEKLLNCSRSTIDRRRKETWQEGIHWWQEGGRKIYNLVLIKDWVMNQHDSVAHQRAIEQWAKRLPSNQGKRKRA